MVQVFQEVKMRKKDVLFFLFILSVTLYYAWDLTIFSNTLQISVLKYVAILFFALSLFYKKYTLQQWVFVCIMLLLVALNFLALDGSANLLLMVCIAILVDKPKIEWALKTLLVCKVAVFVIVAGVAVMGLPVGGLAVSARNLGFTTHNGAPVYLFIIMIAYYLLRKKNERRKSVETLVWLGITVGITLVTGSRTGGIICLLFLVLIILYRNFKVEKLIGFLAIISFPVMFVLSFVLPYYLTNPVVQKLDSILSYRLSLSRSVMFNTNITPFGGEVVFDQYATYMFLDSGYLQLFYTGGAILAVVFTVVYVLIVRKLCMKKHYIMVIACLCFSVYVFSESIMCTYATNFIPLFAYVLFKEKQCVLE